MARRYLAGIWPVLRVVPAAAWCGLGSAACAVAELASPLFSTLGMCILVYGLWKRLSRWRALRRWTPWRP